MKLEPIFWHSYKDCNGHEKIFELIDAAIMVLALEKPDEFLKRRSHIVDVLFKNHRDLLSKACCHSSRISDDVSGVKQRQQQSCCQHHRFKIKLKAHSKPAGEPLPLLHGVNDGKRRTVQEGSQKSAFALKLEATKRKLQESYQDVQNSRRKVRTIDFRDLPPQPFGFQAKSRRSQQIRSH